MRLAPTACLILLLSAPAAGAPQAYREWAGNIDELHDELRRSRSLSDRLAFLRELAAAVRQEAEPRERYVKKLEEVLAWAPNGILLDAIAESLLQVGDRAALEVLLGAFTREDYVSLKKRPLGEGTVASRRRILEYHIFALADRRWEAGPEGPALAEELSSYLTGELGSESGQRARAAACLLGAHGTAAAGPVIAEAFAAAKDSWTKAILLQALGRADPAAAGPRIVASCGSRDIGEQLAAIPLLGHVRGEAADAALAEALNDKRWYVRRAAVEACGIRRDRGSIALLVKHLPEATPRMEREIVKILMDVTGGRLPPTLAEIPDWWAAVGEGFEPAAPGAAAEQPDVMSTRTRGAGKTYFSLAVGSASLCIVFDASGSMAEGTIAFEETDPKTDEKRTVRGNPWEVTQKQIVGLLQGFPKNGRFNLIAYADEVEAFKKKAVKASKSSAKAASKFLTKLKPKGETNLYDGLLTALADPEVDTIFLLSDGKPNRGKRDEAYDILEGIQQENRFRQVTINTIQIGRHSELLERIAGTNGGRYVHVPQVQ